MNRFWPTPSTPRKRTPRPKPQRDVEERTLNDVVKNCGGHLAVFRCKPLSMPNGGCGAHVHVAGTNGGTMPCGAMLTDLRGNTAPYYCGHCSP